MHKALLLPLGSHQTSPQPSRWPINKKRKKKCFADSHRTIISDRCSTTFSPNQILPDLPTKSEAASTRTPARPRAASKSKADKGSKTPNKKLSTPGRNATKRTGGKVTKKSGGGKGKHQKSTIVKKTEAAPTPAKNTKTPGRENDRRSRSSKNSNAGSEIIATIERRTFANDGPVSNEQRYQRLRDLIKPDLDPSLLWTTLEHNGWACKRGTGLISFYYVCSKFAGESPAFIKKNAVHGDEYFRSEDEVKDFCREKLGWVGDGSDSDGKRRDGSCRRINGQVTGASQHKEKLGSVNTAETTPSTNKKRAASPDTQKVSHANAKRLATKSNTNLHAAATGTPQELQFISHVDAAPSTPSIKEPS